MLDMDKEKILLKDIARKEVFKVPEGYFENVTKAIMSQLPDIVHENSVNINLWHRLRPWVYMAAMFAGVALIIRLFVVSPSSLGMKNYASGKLKLTSSSNIDDFFNYFEDKHDRKALHDAFLNADFLEDTDSE